MKFKKNDFIELEFIGRVKDGGVFDTNIKEVVKTMHENLHGHEGHSPDDHAKPVIICLGLGMMLPAIDDFLLNGDFDKGKSYTLELSPDQAFGPRKSNLVRTLSINAFRDQNVRPESGMVFSFDGMLGRISTVSGGRVIVDFNNPLSGKHLVYEITVKDKLDDTPEGKDKMVRALINYFFKSDLPYELDDKNKKVLLKVDDRYKPLIDFFKEKFKQALNLELGVSESSDNNDDSKK